MPALSVVQVGKLPMPMAQVLIESVSESKKGVNAHGLAFISGQAVASGEAVLDVAPLAKKSVDRIRSATFSLGGEVLVDLFAYVELAFARWEFRSPTITLADFNIITDDQLPGDLFLSILGRDMWSHHFFQRQRA